MANKLKLFTLPNIVTIANLACGFVGIQQVFEGNLQNASYCIYLAAIFDFLDGFVARLFKSTSELGKQLDSLCDVVSFGVLPGFMVFALLVEYKWIAIIIPLFSALRLAKFNVDERQSERIVCFQPHVCFKREHSVSRNKWVFDCLSCFCVIDVGGRNAIDRIEV